MGIAWYQEVQILTTVVKPWATHWLIIIINKGYIVCDGKDTTMILDTYDTWGYTLPPYYNILINTRDYKYVVLMPLL